jgi:hypothetical protein
MEPSNVEVPIVSNQINIVKTNEASQTQFTGSQLAQLLTETALIYSSDNDQVQNALYPLDRTRTEILSSCDRVRNAANQLLKENNPGLTLNQFIEKIHDYNLRDEDLSIVSNWKNAIETYNSKMEAKYNCLRPEDMRKRVANLLDTGVTGAWVEVDIAGLKLFNTYNPDKYGDGAIHMVVDHYRRILKDIYHQEMPALNLSRQGDSVYLFIPNEPVDAVKKTLDDEYRSHMGDLKMVIDPQDNQGKAYELPIRLYREQTSIDQNNFDPARILLQEKIEEHKQNTMLKIANEVVGSTDSHLQELLLLLTYVSQKRIPDKIIDLIILNTSNAAQEIQEITKNAGSDDEVISVIKQVASDANIGGILKRILEQVSVEEVEN